METYLVIVLILFCLACVGGMYYNFTRIIKDLKKESPTGTVTQDDAFNAFAEMLIESIPEFVAGYKSILSDAETDETKMRIVVDTIVNDVLDYIAVERHSDPKIETISKLIVLIPIEMVKSSIANAATEVINKYLDSERERESKIIDMMAENLE